MIHFKTEAIDRYNATIIAFDIDGGVTTVDEAFVAEPPKAPLDKGVILSGRGPIWLFARLTHYYHPALWVAVHDPRIGYIVVQSHCKERYSGEVLAQLCDD